MNKTWASRTVTVFACLLCLAGRGTGATDDSAVAGQLLVDLRADDLATGAALAWPNRGSLGGEFMAVGSPQVIASAGWQYVALDGSSYFIGPNSVPAIEGPDPHSIEIWVYKNSVSGEQTMVSWSRRGGPDGSNMAFNYAGDPSWGAVAHWGAGPDMGWGTKYGPNPTLGKWHHLAYTYDGTTSRVYVDGDLASQEAMTLATHPNLPIRVGAQGDNTGFGTTMPFIGWIAQVRIHDGALTNAQIQQNAKLGPPAPLGLSPEAGAGIDKTFVQLSWQPGRMPVEYRVYLSEDPNLVAASDPSARVATLSGTVRTLYVGVPGMAYPDGLIRGVTYYWKVEQISEGQPDTPVSGDVWEFLVKPLHAYGSVPADEGKHVPTTATLSWQKGADAFLHYVVLGTDADAVAKAAIGSGMPQVTTTYAPVGLVPNTTYFWRVDEFSPSGQTQGPVWSFTTIADLPIEDESLLGWWTMDQVDAPVVVDESGHGLHGAIQGQLQWVEGVDGAAIELTADDLITVPAPNVTIDTATMTGWIKPAKVHGRTGLIFMRAGTQTCGIDLMPNNQLGYHWLDDILTWDYASGLVVPVGEWSFVAMVAEPTQVVLYLDGTDISRSQVQTHGPASFSSPITLGSDTLAADRRFVGAMDDLRFYNRALSADEIETVAVPGVRPERPVDPAVVEDFDSYNAYSGQGGQDVWDAWSDGYGGNGTGSTAGNIAEPFMSRDAIAPGAGGQAMPLGYNNTGSFTDYQGQMVSKTLSEVVRSFQPAQDLTRDGATSLSLWVRGSTANTAEPSDVLYVLVKDAAGKEAQATIASAADLAKPFWRLKQVGLSDLAGVDLTRITSMTLGIGNRTSPQFGGAGVVLIDNIALSQD